MELEMSPEDSSPVILNADQKAVAVKQIRDLVSALSYFGQLVEQDALEVTMGQNLLRIAEAGLVDISKLTKLEIDSVAERERRHAMLRAANMRVRELEQKMGEAAGILHVQMGIQDLGKKLNSWWDLEGFGHLSSLDFTAHGHCEVVFSCMLFGDFPLIGSETPISDKERKSLWRKSLKDRGFVLSEDPDEKEAVIDCDASRKTLCQLFADRLPSAQVLSINTHGNRRGELHLRDVKVFIHNLEDIVSLPQLPRAK